MSLGSWPQQLLLLLGRVKLPSLHIQILSAAVTLLQTDGKEDAYTFFSTEAQYRPLLAAICKPDRGGDFEHGAGLHYYCSRKPNGKQLSAYGAGKYYPNSHGDIARSARTLLEEDLTMALFLYRAGQPEAAMDSLGRALHFLADIGCMPHAIGLTYNSPYRWLHQFYERKATGLAPLLHTHDLRAGDLYDLYFPVHPLTVPINLLATETAQARTTPFLEQNCNALILSQYRRCVQHTTALLYRFYLQTQVTKCAPMRYRIQAIDSCQDLALVSNQFQLSDDPVIWKFRMSSNAILLCSDKRVFPDYLRIAKRPGGYTISTRASIFTAVLTRTASGGVHVLPFQPNQKRQLWQLHAQ